MLFSVWRLLMHLRFENISAQNSIQLPELQVRALHTPLTEDRLQYVVYDNSEEVAFVSFDLCAEYDDSLVLYEVFVAEKNRRQGTGSAVIRHAEAIASELGYERVLVRPEPLSSDITKAALIAWYRERGFTPCKENPDLFQKEVVKS